MSVQNVALVAVTPLSAHSMLVFLLQLTLLLACASSCGALASRMGMPAVVGELLAGVVLGPSLLPHLGPAFSKWLFPQDSTQMHLLDALGQIGVILLVGIAGAQFDLRGVRRNARRAAAVSVCGLVVPLILGFGIGFVLPVPMRPENSDRITFSSLFAIAICVSAIPVIAKTLLDLNLMHRDIGQLIMTASVVEDTIGWILLAVVSAAASGGLHPFTFFYSTGMLCGFLIIAAVVGKPLVQASMARIVRSGDAGRVSSFAVVLVIGGAAATQALGLEAILGAFVCGVLIGTSASDATWLAPLNNVVMSVLAPLFFAAAGLRMDVSAIAHVPVALCALAVLGIAIFGKFLGAFIGARLSKLSSKEALALGAGLNARGVIEVIIAILGLRLGVLGAEAYTTLILVAVATSLMAAPLLRWALADSEVTADEVARERRISALRQPSLDQEAQPEREVS